MEDKCKEVKNDDSSRRSPPFSSPALLTEEGVLGHVVRQRNAVKGRDEVPRPDPELLRHAPGRHRRDQDARAPGRREGLARVGRGEVRAVLGAHQHGEAREGQPDGALPDLDSFNVGIKVSCCCSAVTKRDDDRYES